MSKINPIFLITPTTQKYEWGKIGNSSKVAQLLKSAAPDFVLDECTPYAEVSSLRSLRQSTPLSILCLVGML